MNPSPPQVKDDAAASSPSSQELVAAAASNTKQQPPDQMKKLEGEETSIDTTTRHKEKEGEEIESEEKRDQKELGPKQYPCDASAKKPDNGFANETTTTTNNQGQNITTSNNNNNNNNNNNMMNQKIPQNLSTNFAINNNSYQSATATYNLPPQPEHHVEAAKKFKIRTSNRRHLDFDAEYDLDDVSAPERSKWSGPFHFIQAADSQFGMIDSYTYKKTEPGWQEEIKLCEQLVNICNEMEPKPKFMIICGDLVDSRPATSIGSQQVVDFKRIFSKLNNQIPLVCVCGNHDVGDEPTDETVEDYRRTFGDDYFYFTSNDVLFIVINSQFYQHRDNVKQYAQEQDKWLEQVLAKCKLFKYSIVFEHIPWFLKNFDEEDDYFNIKKEVRLIWLRKFKEAGVTKIMCGHYHRNAGGWFEDMELVVTSAIGAQCGEDKSGVRIVKLLDDTIEHQYYPMQEIPQKVELSCERG